MSWFGFGGSKQPEEPRSEIPARIDTFEEDSFANVPEYSNGGGGSFQEQLMIEQQKMILQAVMMKLTDLSFDRCVTKPGTSISYNEQNCITASVGKFVDTSQLVMKRFQMAQDGTN